MALPQSAPREISVSQWKEFWQYRTFANQLMDDAFIDEPPATLKKIFHAGRFFFMVLDYQSMKLSYVNGLENLMGYTDAEALEGNYLFIAGLLHPDDMPKVLGLAVYFYQFIDQQSPKTRLNFRASLNFRMRKKNGDYIDVLEEVVGLRQDNDGKITHALKYFTDVSHLSLSSEVVLSILDATDETNQKFYTFQIDKKEVATGHNTNSFTKRELEILALIAAGSTTKEIASDLKVSLHTINKHRENMMRKTMSKNINEVISFAYLNDYLK